MSAIVAAARGAMAAGGGVQRGARSAAAAPLLERAVRCLRSTQERGKAAVKAQSWREGGERGGH